LFKKSPGVWAGLFLTYLLIQLLIEALSRAIPLVGLFLRPVLQTPLQGGVMLGCAAQERNEPLRLSHLFAGFSWEFGPLVRLGFLFLVPAIAAGLVVGIALMALSGGTAPAGLPGGPGRGIQLVIVGVVTVPVSIGMLMAGLFSPALVVFHDLPPFEAMKSSFFACLRNYRPILSYAAIGMALTILGLIPFGLGLLVVGPVVTAAAYYGYRDIFFSSEPD